MLADVSEFAEVEAVVARAVERFGRLDVLISNAGVLSPNGRIHNLATEEWERAFRINLLGAVNGIRAAVAVMRPQRSGSIMLTASVSGMTAWSHAAPYCATKAAVIQLAKVAAVEYARDGIRVNCVCPGTFRSAIHDDLPPDALDAIAARHPLGLGSAADLVGAYSYLAERRVALDDRVGHRRRRRVLGAVRASRRRLGDGLTIPRMKMSANGFATSRADSAPTRLQPQVRVVVHARARPWPSASAPASRNSPESTPACRTASTRRSYSRRRSRNCAARSPVSAGNSCRKTQT